MNRLSAPTAAFGVAILATLACNHRTPPPASPADTAAAVARQPDRFPLPPHSVAPIVSPEWSTESERDHDREADTVAKLLHIAPGSAVADIGAGRGYYTVRLAPRVGPAGRIYAEDITPSYVDALARRVTDSHLANVTVILGAPDDPHLPAGAVDVALLIHMYHEVRQPFALLSHLDRSLRAGATVGIVDLDRPTASHGTPPTLLRCEVESIGYRETALYPLPRGYLAVFTAPAAADLTPSDQIAARLNGRGCPTTS